MRRHRFFLLRPRQGLPWILCIACNLLSSSLSCSSARGGVRRMKNRVFPSFPPLLFSSSTLPIACSDVRLLSFFYYWLGEAYTSTHLALVLYQFLTTRKLFFTMLTDSRIASKTSMVSDMVLPKTSRPGKTFTTLRTGTATLFYYLCACSR